MPWLLIQKPAMPQILADPLPGSRRSCNGRSDGSILMGKNDQIFKLKPGEDKNWTPIAIESNLPIKNITRLVISPNGSKIGCCG